MLTRELLSSGAYLDSFADLPEHPVWPIERIQASMLETLAQRPSGQPVWLFAYGSLIWNPLIDFAEQRRCVLHGWHRSFCIRLIASRGTPEKPGRMLALEAGGEIHGVAFRMDEASLLEELRLVWIREMVGGVYVPRWTPVTLDDGSTVQAIIFAANPEHVLYEPDSRLETVAPLVAGARGQYGSNTDYVLDLERSLSAHGIADADISALAGELRASGCAV